MRLLFDEQLSNRLPHLLADCYPESLHIEALNLRGAPNWADDGSIDGRW
jgi:predicted nuclease of predicted toxin-antitoxin system